VKAAGKYFSLGSEKFYMKGFSYGPFAPNSNDEPLPEREEVRRDFRHIRELGANTIRVYFPPPVWLLDEARAHRLYVFIDVPWEKHRCFFEDWEAMERARKRVATTARELGNHPAVFAISVVNEFPVDIVRFQGRRRVERFVEQLLTIAKNEAPDCLVTFVNFPTTEFLEVKGADFVCFNVYVHDEGKFGSYLDRLQHIAGNKPLILGEYGIDSKREGEAEQAAILIRHLHRVFHHGLAGSVVFAYTDDWFTGGQQITDWFFGITRADRSEKEAAAGLRKLWHRFPEKALSDGDLPKISVVVCTYNGSATLEACLQSLMQLDYPNYEVVLVNDGSTDGCAEIVSRFPKVLVHSQENRGLSLARNVGARMASGEIVAYTDDDCEVDEHWLLYLERAMRDQQVEGIGGPNITPADDGWVAKCVAASPGNPSHVMLDDRHAEHVPGCNMAFRRDVLLGLGGFDPQFRAAGDDVDICWRLIDAGFSIGYASGAMVWHHRRATVKAYAKQQKGYGKSEAIVHYKHPQRFGTFGSSRWNGVIYGDGAVGLPLLPDRIYHGQFGDGLFQTIYRHNQYGPWWVIMSLEWHLSALFVLLLATLFWPLAGISLIMWSMTAALAVRSARRAPLERNSHFWCRPLVAYLYVMQPIWRGWNRLTHFLRRKRSPDLEDVKHEGEVKHISSTVRDLYWQTKNGKGRQELLINLVENASGCKWAGDFDNAWADWDVKLVGDRWHDLTLVTATEEQGWPRRFTRVRCRTKATLFQRAFIGGVVIWTLTALLGGPLWTIVVGAAGLLFVGVRIRWSRRHCLRAAERLIGWAAVDAGLLATPGDDQEVSSELSDDLSSRVEEGELSGASGEPKADPSSDRSAPGDEGEGPAEIGLAKVDAKTDSVDE
jgi:GT2 family glycosyltransferase